MTREEVREMALEGKDRLGLTWLQVGEAIGRSPVYAALLVYGYGQATAEEAEGLGRILALPLEAQAAMGKVPHRARRSLGRQPILSSTASTKRSCFTGRYTRMWPMNCSATAS